jgi:TonB family protein
MYTVQAQYMAYVRARIRQVNERIMPRSWIAEVLSRKVSADFTVVLGRGGRFISARLVRSSGYARLDDVARDAIYIASPFEGYPPEAGDTITLTVTVYYTPWR